MWDYILALKGQRKVRKNSGLKEKRRNICLWGTKEDLVEENERRL